MATSCAPSTPWASDNAARMTIAALFLVPDGVRAAPYNIGRDTSSCSSPSAYGAYLRDPDGNKLGRYSGLSMG